MIQDQDQDFHFVLEAPRDQDPGLEDSIAGFWDVKNKLPGNILRYLYFILVNPY